MLAAVAQGCACSGAHKETTDVQQLLHKWANSLLAHSTAQVRAVGCPDAPLGIGSKAPALVGPE